MNTIVIWGQLVKNRRRRVRCKLSLRQETKINIVVEDKVLKNCWFVNFVSYGGDRTSVITRDRKVGGWSRARVK